MDIDGVNAYLKDMVFTNDPDSPVVCGFFRMEKGAPLEYTYTYDDIKIILEGEMTVSEENGKTIEAKPGDVFLYKKGAKITFASNSSGLGFYCGQRAAEDL
jgi:ethanolamine utilization protein EutQ (cupin superfamily)